MVGQPRLLAHEDRALRLALYRDILQLKHQVSRLFPGVGKLINQVKNLKLRTPALICKQPEAQTGKGGCDGDTATPYFHPPEYSNGGPDGGPKPAGYDCKRVEPSNLEPCKNPSELRSKNSAPAHRMAAGRSKGAFMSLRFWLVAAAVAASTLVPYIRSGIATVPTQAAPLPAQGTSTLSDQRELAITVYNSDIALVRDVRELDLPRGTFDLEFQDIAATVNPATVHLRSLTEPTRVSVLEQNYEYDLLEPDKLLKKYVGREVTLVRTRQEGGATREELVKARLLSFNSAPVWQIGSEIVTGFHPDHVRFPELPGNLHARPTLIWSLANQGALRHRVEASYLAGQTVVECGLRADCCA